MKILMLLIHLSLSNKIDKSQIRSPVERYLKQSENFSDKILYQIQTKLQDLMNQRQRYFDDDNDLVLDPSQHLSNELSKEKIIKGVSIQGAKQYDHFYHFKGQRNLKNFDRFNKRLLKYEEMECTLYARNHGLEHQASNITIFRVEYKSNCFRNTFTQVYLYQNEKQPWWVVLSHGFGSVIYAFRRLSETENNTNYNIHPNWKQVVIKEKTWKKSPKQGPQKLVQLNGSIKIPGSLKKKKGNTLKKMTYPFKSYNRWDKIIGNITEFFQYEELMKLWDGEDIIKCKEGDNSRTMTCIN